MSGWILSVVTIIVLGVFLEILLPEGQTTKYVKAVFGVITVLVIISPLPEALGKIGTGELFSSVEFELDDNYILSTKERSFSNKELLVERELEHIGYSAQVRIVEEDGYMSKIDYVNVIVSSEVISKENANIDISKIQKCVSEILFVEESEVRVIGFD